MYDYLPMFELSVLLSKIDVADLTPLVPVPPWPAKPPAPEASSSAEVGSGEPVGEGFHGSKSDLFISFTPPQLALRFLPSSKLSTEELLVRWLCLNTSTLSRKAVLGVNAWTSQSFTLDKTLQKDGLGERDFALGLLGPIPPVRFEETSSPPPFFGLLVRFAVLGHNVLPCLIGGRPAPFKLLVLGSSKHPPRVSLGTFKFIDMLVLLSGQLEHWCFRAISRLRHVYCKRQSKKVEKSIGLNNYF